MVSYIIVYSNKKQFSLAFLKEKAAFRQLLLIIAEEYRHNGIYVRRLLCTYAAASRPRQR